MRNEMTTARPFQEARELDAREAECWAMFSAEPPRWSEELVRARRPVLMSTEDFYRLCAVEEKS